MTGMGLLCAGALVCGAEFRPGQDFSAYEERPVISCIIGPFNQRKVFSIYFNAGDTEGMDTAAGIHIGEVGCVQSGAVGMSGDQRISCFCGKAGQTLLYFIFMSVVFCCTGWVQHSVALQGTPDVTYKEAVDLPAGGVPKICLMPVGQIDTAAAAGVFQNQAFVKGQSRKQFLMTLGVRAEKGTAESLGIAGTFLFHIMVAVKQIKSVLPVKEGEKLEDIAVDFDDLLHVSVFPKFISIPQLDIGKTVSTVIFQGRKIKTLVFEKIIV